MKRLRTDDTGATLVETTIVLTLLFILLMGVIDFGRYAGARSAVNTASREAARYGSSVGTSVNGVPRYTDCAEIRNAGVGLDLAVELDPVHFTVEYDNGPSTGVFQTCPDGGPNPNPATITDGDRIVVTVARDFDMVTPFIDDFFGAITITSVDRRSIQNP